MLYRLLSLDGSDTSDPNPMGAKCPWTWATAAGSARGRSGRGRGLLLSGRARRFGLRGTRASAEAAALPPPPPPRPVVAEALAALLRASPGSVGSSRRAPAPSSTARLRIDTSFSVPGEPRRYRVFEAGRGMSSETYDKPAGILFHTSESDIWPLDEAHNEKLRDSSQGLLRYLKRNLVYHYLVDRFGRVFRVVDEESKANHAGQAVWNARVPLLEPEPASSASASRRREGGGLPITAAQLARGGA